MPRLASPLGKGPVWQTFDRWFSRSDELARLGRKIEVLLGLQNSERFTDMVHPPHTWSPDAVDALREHINTDWFGLVPDGRGGWRRPPELDNPTSAQRVGAWLGWRGDAEAMTRETVIRAIEVSLGLQHITWSSGATVSVEDYGVSSSAAPRNWPIEFWSVSPSPSFGAALAWRHEADDPTSGLVTVVWFTPADGSGLPAMEDGETNVADSRFGLWLIGQSMIDPISVQTWRPSARGEWTSPLPALFSHGNVTTVAPAPDAGGVDPNAAY